VAEITGAEEGNTAAGRKIDQKIPATGKAGTGKIVSCFFLGWMNRRKFQKFRKSCDLFLIIERYGQVKNTNGYSGKPVAIHGWSGFKFGAAYGFLTLQIFFDSTQGSRHQLVAVIRIG
jgi:hypothetical protein